MVAKRSSTWQVRAAAGEPLAAVRVENLQATIQGPGDAWGRKDRPQPVSVSAAVMLNRAFGASSAADRVSADTIHYGLLSKAILSTLGKPVIRTDLRGDTWDEKELQDVVENIWADLTAMDSSGDPVGHRVTPFLDLAAVRCLEVTVRLPKASLLGSGVSLTNIALIGTDSGRPSVQMQANALRIHDLRVPTLIGVNDNERRAKQVVVASVELEKIVVVSDAYPRIEEEAVRAMSNSSFETLEALAHHMSAKIVQGKPVAIPFADAACVELRTNSNDFTHLSGSKDGCDADKIKM